MTVLQIYVFAVLLPSIARFCAIVGCLSGIGVIASVMVWIFGLSESELNRAKKNIKLCLILCLCALSITIPIPSREDSALMFAGAYASNIKGIKDLPPNAVALINQYMESAVKKGGK